MVGGGAPHANACPVHPPTPPPQSPITVVGGVGQRTVKASFKVLRCMAENILRAGGKHQRLVFKHEIKEDSWRVERRLIWATMPLVARAPTQELWQGIGDQQRAVDFVG